MSDFPTLGGIRMCWCRTLMPTSYSMLKTMMYNDVSFIVCWDNFQMFGIIGCQSSLRLVFRESVNPIQ